MEFYFSHTDLFGGQPVETFDPRRGASNLASCGVALRSTVDPGEDVEYDLVDLLYTLLEDPGIHQLQTLVIGPCWRGDLHDVVGELIENRGMLPALRALFVGDLIWEDTQISWIELPNLSPLLKAFPKLEVFQVRGCGERVRPDMQPVRFEDPIHHEHLRTLTIQTGGLAREALEELCNAHLPSLERLVLWLGEDHQGGNITSTDLMPLLSGKRFPKLHHLGLKNSGIQAEIITGLLGAPILRRLKTLDLSMGLLRDADAEPLLTAPEIHALDALDLSWSYLSPAMCRRFEKLPCDVCVASQRDRRASYLYCAVGE